MPVRRPVLASFLILTVIAGIGSCGGGGTEPAPPPPQPGPFSASQSQLTASSPSVASGSSATLTLQLKDASGLSLTTGGAAVVFTLGGGTSGGTLGSTTDNGNGSYTNTFTATIVGTARTIGVTVNGTAITSTLPAITTTPGPASVAQSVVESSASSVVTGGTATLTLRVKDAAGNALTAGGLTVTFTKGSGTSDGTIGPVTDNANGTYTATFTATTAGTARSFGATIGGSAVSSASPTILVTPPTGPISAANSVVTLNAATVASGSAVTITLQGKDAAGVNVTLGGATVAFSLGVSGTSTGTIGAVTDNTNGTYTAALTGVVAGTARAITATVNGTAVTTTQPTVTVTPGPASATTSVVTLSGSTIPSGSNLTITLQAKDAADNTVTSGGATVAFALGVSGGSTGTVGSVTDNANGTYTATLTGLIAGSARAITATINAAVVSTTQPTFTVTPGPASAATSEISASSPTYLESGTSMTVTLVTKDAAGNSVLTGGATVAFSLGSGTSDGTFGAVTNPGNGGVYQASFTGSTAGTPRAILATLNGVAVTTASPTIAVFVKGLTLSTTSVLANATTGLASAQQFVAIFANGGTKADGMQANVVYTDNGISACTTSSWVGPLTFDFPNADPVSIVSFTPTAALLGVYSCTANVTISSTTAGYASQTFAVTLSVARGAIAQTAVNLVTMGNAGNNVLQDLTPSAKVLITNGGRGVVTGVHANVTDQTSVDDPTPWLTDLDLTWDPPVADTNARTLPRTLTVRTKVKPFSASAIVHVTGTGIATIDIPVSVLFNVEPELVTNPRGVAFTAFAGGPPVALPVLAFNQNRTISPSDSLRNFARDATALPSWLSVSFTPLRDLYGMDTAATVTVTANPVTLLADSVYTDTVRLKADHCATSAGYCTLPAPFNPVKFFKLPVRLTVERGLVVSVANATLFAPVGTATVTRDIAITNGGSTTISGLSASVGGASWLSAAFIGGTAAPSTLRLTANPTGLARGSVFTTTVTVSASSPSGVPSKSFPVTLRVY